MAGSKKAGGVALMVLGLAITGFSFVYLELTGHQVLVWQRPEQAPMLCFLANLLGLALLVLGLGYAVTGLPSGFCMSNYNKYSLSKLQISLWTVLVVAAFATAAEANIIVYAKEFADPQHPALRLADQPMDATKNPRLGPLDIQIPGELLVAMGISLASLAGASAVLALKGSQTPATADALEAARQRVASSGGVDSASVSNTGMIATRLNRSDARWVNIVSGDEVANDGMVDLSKVQQLLITLMLVLGYAGMLVSLFSGGKRVAELPPLGSYAVGLLAISHAGYLAYKAAPKAAPEMIGATTAQVDAAAIRPGAAVRRMEPAAAPPPAPAT